MFGFVVNKYILFWAGIVYYIISREFEQETFYTLVERKFWA